MTCEDGFGQSGLVVRENPDPNLIRDVFTGRNKPPSRVEHRGVDLEDRDEKDYI